jgi:hypothetical protein
MTDPQLHPFQGRLRSHKVQNFLSELYELQSDEKRKRDRIIDQASRENIEVLLRLLHLILTKEIPIKSTKHYAKIRQSRKMPHMLQHFQNENNFRSLKANTLENKKNVLRQITTYKELLNAIFH